MVNEQYSVQMIYFMLKASGQEAFGFVDLDLAGFKIERGHGYLLRPFYFRNDTGD